MNSVVSIIIPCHNAGRYVGAALESALSQTWSSCEVIVVDDGSTDESAKTIARYVDQGVRAITPSRPPRSASRSRNIGFSESTGRYVKFFDADDLMHSEMVEKQMQCLNGAEHDIAMSDWGRFYQDDLSTFQSIGITEPYQKDAREWLVESWANAKPMTQPGMFLLPRGIVSAVGGWNEAPSPSDDFEFFARILCAADKVKYTPGVPLYYRSGLPNSLSKQTSASAVAAAAQSLLDATHALMSVRSDYLARRSCANVLQNFIYTWYPHFPEQRRLLSQRVADLGGSDLVPDGPPKFQLLRRVIGWKAARLVQRAVKGS